MAAGILIRGLAAGWQVEGCLPGRNRMPRQPRPGFAGVLQHVVQRGDDCAKPRETGTEEVKYPVPRFLAVAVASINHDDLRHMTGNVMVVS